MAGGGPNEVYWLEITDRPNLADDWIGVTRGTSDLPPWHHFDAKSQGTPASLQFQRTPAPVSS
jgi:hypothetical protein